MTTKRITRRVDADQVRIMRDGRVVYWSGGVPGEGRRIFTRPRLGQSPEQLAGELRSTLGTPPFDGGRRTVLQLCRVYFDAHHHDTATNRKYRRALHKHVLGVIGEGAVVTCAAPTSSRSSTSRSSGARSPTRSRASSPR